jgi:integrase
VIVKRGKRWGVRVYGGGRQRWVGTFNTLREAKRAEREASSAPMRGGSEMCDEFVARWLRDYPRPSAGTRALNASMVKPFANDFTGIPLDAVDRPRARAWAREHPASVRYVQTMFADAVRDEILTVNPWVGMRPPRSRGRRDLRVLTEAQLHELADVALEVHDEYGPTMRAMILFSGFVGLRLGQLFALTWEDISGDEVKLIAQKRAPAHIAIIAEPALDALRAMPRRVDLPFVFTGRAGLPLKRGAHRLAWEPVRIAAGRPDFPWHGLRHTAATLMLERGADHEAVRIQLGHTSVREVQQTYGHPDHERARERLRLVFDKRVTPLRAAPSRRLGSR